MPTPAQLRARRLFVQRYGHRAGSGRRNPNGEHAAHQAREGGGGSSSMIWIVAAAGVGLLIFSRGGLFGTSTVGGYPVASPSQLPAGTIVGAPGQAAPFGYRQVAVTSTGQPIYVPTSMVSSIANLPGVQQAGVSIIGAIGGFVSRFIGNLTGGGDTLPGTAGPISTADILRPVDTSVVVQDLGTVGDYSAGADVLRPVDLSTWVDPSSGAVMLGPVAPDPNMVPIDLTGMTWIDPGSGALLLSPADPGGPFVALDLPPGGWSWDDFGGGAAEVGWDPGGLDPFFAEV